MKHVLACAALSLLANGCCHLIGHEGQDEDPPTTCDTDLDPEHADHDHAAEGCDPEEDAGDSE